MPAPLIATALTSIGAYLAKNGLDLLAGIFRGAVDKGTEDVASLIEEKTGIDINKAAEEKGLTPDELVKLKDFELQYQSLLLKHSEAVEDLALKRESAYLESIKNAQAMQISAMSSNDIVIRQFVYWFALLLSGASFGFIYCVLFRPELIQAANRDLVNTIVGFLLGTSLSSVIGFFYGSSKGSADKTEQLSALTNQLAATSMNRITGK